MLLLNFSKRASDFIDAADVGGNIRNSYVNLNYINVIDLSCTKAGITTGAVYPVIGGIEESMRFNFLNPSQYKLDFLGGGWIFSDAGANPNGTTSYADTHILPQTDLNGADCHLSFFSNTESTQTNNPVEIGTSYVNGETNLWQYALCVGQGSPNRTMLATINSNSFPSMPISTSKGMLLSSRIVNAQRLIYQQNGIDFNNNIGTSSIPVNMYSLKLSCTHLSAGQTTRHSDRGIGFASIGNSMTTEKGRIFSHDITYAQRSIGRGI